MIDRTYLEMMLAGNMRPGQIVARQFGVSRETVRRSRIRAGDWLSPTGWPPAIPHGFGLSAAERRRSIIRAHGRNPYNDGKPIDLAQEHYQVPIPDQEDLDGDAW